VKKPTWQVLSLVAVAFLLGACDAEKSDDTADTQPAAVRAVPVASVAVASQTRAVGVLAPRDEIRLAFKVGESSIRCVQSLATSCARARCSPN